MRRGQLEVRDDQVADAADRLARLALGVGRDEDRTRATSMMTTATTRMIAIRAGSAARRRGLVGLGVRARGRGLVGGLWRLPDRHSTSWLHMQRARPSAALGQDVSLRCSPGTG